MVISGDEGLVCRILGCQYLGGSPMATAAYGISYWLLECAMRCNVISTALKQYLDTHATFISHFNHRTSNL